MRAMQGAGRGRCVPVLCCARETCGLPWRLEAAASSVEQRTVAPDNAGVEAGAAPAAWEAGGCRVLGSNVWGRDDAREGGLEVAPWVGRKMAGSMGMGEST